MKLLDFGIAKGPEVGIAGNTTRTGSFVGSPYYMSPEQVVGARDVDFRTDLWALGVVAFEALTGRKPFSAPSVGALALKIHRNPLPVPSTVNASLSTAVDSWFLRACARDPAERFASAKEMAESLAVALVGDGRSGLLLDGVASLVEREGVTPTRVVPEERSTSAPKSIGARDGDSGASMNSAGTSATRAWVLGALVALALAAGVVAVLTGGIAKAKVAPSDPPAAPAGADRAVTTIPPRAADLAHVEASEAAPANPVEGPARAARSAPTFARAAVGTPSPGNTSVDAKPARALAVAPRPVSSAVSADGGSLAGAAPVLRHETDDDIK